MFTRLWGGEDGATAVEYAIMAVLIAAVVVGIVQAVGLKTNSMFELVNTGWAG